MSMYIRAKRKNQTLFLHVEPSYNFSQIKQKIGETLRVDALHIQLFQSDKKKELLDNATISDQEIKNDDVIYMIFLREGGGWEEIQVESLLSVASGEELGI